MKFELSIKIDGWNEYKIHYDEENYNRLLILLQALLTEFEEKQKDLK